MPCMGPSIDKRLAPLITEKLYPRIERLVSKDTPPYRLLAHTKKAIEETFEELYGWVNLGQGYRYQTYEVYRHTYYIYGVLSVLLPGETYGVPMDKGFALATRINPDAFLKMPKSVLLNHITKGIEDFAAEDF